MNEKHYIVYKTTNLITDEFYIGVHGQTEDDDYLGSGIHLQRQVRKYRKENFIRETLSVFASEEQAFAEEKSILKDFLNDELCLNISEGGDGGPNFKGMQHSEGTKEILRKKRAKQKALSEASRAKISEANRRRIVSPETKEKLAKLAKSRHTNPDVRKQISESLKRTNIDRKAQGLTKHSPETKKKLSASAKRRFSDEKQRKTVSDSVKKGLNGLKSKRTNGLLK